MKTPNTIAVLDIAVGIKKIRDEDYISLTDIVKF